MWIVSHVIGIAIVFIVLLLEIKAISQNVDGNYSNKFAVQLKGGDHTAREVASGLGFQFVKKIGNLENYYLFEQVLSSRQRRTTEDHIPSLSDDPRVEWYKQQTPLIRTKRETSGDQTPLIRTKREASGDQTPLIRTKREASGGDNVIGETKGASPFNDPRWEKQWYFHDTHLHTMNVFPVWNRDITGRGVVVTILDDGIEYTNDDISSNYDKKASYDYNDNDDDPFPRYDSTNFNRHGTRCAGVVAMQANNTICGTGVAFNAKIGGIRMLDGNILDSTEAEGFGHRNSYVDIYSCSWGPSDDSETVDGPHRLGFEALDNAIEKGRNGKGSIFVWASGNGGKNGDDCICDGYSSSIFTISVSGVENNKIPVFAEKCSSTMTSTYSFSSTAPIDSRITTTDLHNQCISGFSGTSASTPMAAGILALALQVNPNLTWRDVQHIVVWTSNSEALREEQGWYQNAIGLWVNRAFGFGLMDADAIVKMADPKTWRTVPEKYICILQANNTGFTPQAIGSNKTLTIQMSVDGCRGTQNHVRYLEHVELFLHIEYPRRGALNINVTSFSGTETMLLSTREKDLSTEGFKSWPFVSVHTWGEEPAPSEGDGIWKLEIWDSIPAASVREGLLKDWVLAFHGTNELPDHRKAMTSKKKNGKEKRKIAEDETADALLEPPSEPELLADDTDAKSSGRQIVKQKWRYLHSLHRLE